MRWSTCCRQLLISRPLALFFVSRAAEEAQRKIHPTKVRGHHGLEQGFFRSLKALLIRHYGGQEFLHFQLQTVAILSRGPGNGKHLR